MFIDIYASLFLWVWENLHKLLMCLFKVVMVISIGASIKSREEFLNDCIAN